MLRGQKNNGKVQFFARVIGDTNVFIPARWRCVDLTQIESLWAGEYR
jgi:hypothetical protein